MLGRITFDGRCRDRRWVRWMFSKYSARGRSGGGEVVWEQLAMLERACLSWTVNIVHNYFG